MLGTRAVRIVAGLLAVLLVLAGIAYLVRPAGGAPAQQVQPAACAVRADPVPGAAESGLPVQPLCALPAEVARTWQLIAADGPFPYERDGIVFNNRERLLPQRPSGWYHEYTVPTPGSKDRGARRLVTGGSPGPDRQVFYSGDHYRSFVVVDVTAGATS
ncbi:ribonuclease domain-containing protein [Pseudonocardia sp. CA-107938]|uniref:ribonuclease domain-containing protein n=1 Tax=Pseudonocardia sp. CA-107938 TaxID=3240021 RepID=UPI003D8E2926